MRRMEVVAHYQLDIYILFFFVYPRETRAKPFLILTVKYVCIRFQVYFICFRVIFCAFMHMACSTYGTVLNLPVVHCHLES